MSVKKNARKSSYPAAVPYEPGLLDELKDPVFAAQYLTACLVEGGDPSEELEVFCHALGQVAKAWGVQDAARAIGVSRDSLYKIFADHHNPKLETLRKLLAVFDLDMQIVPKQKKASRASKR